MHDVLFGMESELAFSAQQFEVPDPNQGALFERPTPIAAAIPAALLDIWVKEFLALAGEQLCCLPDGQTSGAYLANGSRLYIDAGRHPEFCTPECTRPEELVCAQLAGERILANLAADLMKSRPHSQIALFRCNVDYSGTQSTWGCHESYQHEADPTQMRAHLIPHLVTRIVYTGAGGFNNRQTQAEFLLSPRVPHLLHEAGLDSQSERSLYHTKNEALGSGGFHRLHLICGESNASHLSTYLKFGTTALIVRLIDAGVCRGSELRFRRPLQAMNLYARDPSCRTRARIRKGHALSAIEIQREYLAMVEAHLDADFMPDWAPLVCERWRDILDRLEADPISLSTSLDWAIKHALFEDRIARSNANWRDLQLAEGLGAELCEIDMRFGELGPAGLFHALDRAGVLDHRLPEMGSVEEAMNTPPPGGRAEVRGRAIRELRIGAQPDRYQCLWNAIYDRQGQRVFDMSDSYGREAHWRDLNEAGPPPIRSNAARRARDLANRVQRGIDFYQRSDLPAACVVLDAAATEARDEQRPESEALARFWCATAHHDAGRLQAAEDVLAPILDTVRESASSVTACRVLTRHAVVLIDRPAPRARIEAAIERARDCIEGMNGPSGRSRVGMLEARFEGSLGNYARAIERMEAALVAEQTDPIAFARSTYQRWLVSYLLRSGELDHAGSVLEQWREDVESDLARSENRIMIACAESVRARFQGRFEAALEHARVAVSRAESPDRNRYLANAQCALIFAALAAGEPETARPLVEEIETWPDIEIGEQRCDIELAKAAYYRAAGEGRATGTLGPNAFARPATRTPNTEAEIDESEGAKETLSWNEALALAEDTARSVALEMDERLGTRHHVREVAESGRPVG